MVTDGEPPNSGLIAPRSFDLPPFQQPGPVFAGRLAEPPMGSAKERALVSVAEQIGDFRESHSRVGQIVLRQFVARGVNKIREKCALLSQPALESVIASAGR